MSSQLWALSADKNVSGPRQIPLGNDPTWYVCQFACIWSKTQCFYHTREKNTHSHIYKLTDSQWQNKIILISPLCGKIGRGVWCGFQGQQTTCWSHGRSLPESVWGFPLGKWSVCHCHDLTPVQWWMSCFQAQWNLCRNSSKQSLKDKPTLTDIKWRYDGAFSKWKFLIITTVSL